MKLISLKKYGKHCSQTLVLSYEQALTGTFLHLQDNILHGYCLASSSVAARRSVSYHSVATRLQRLFKRKGSKVFVLFDLLCSAHFSGFVLEKLLESKEFWVVTGGARTESEPDHFSTRVV